MITLTTKTNAARRETTVSAKDAKGNEICCETWSGTGARVAVALAAHVRTNAEQQVRRLNIAAATSPAESRLLTARL